MAIRAGSGANSCKRTTATCWPRSVHSATRGHALWLYFASATRSQFYFDGNKRTARIMMTGSLIQSGFEPVNIPFARQEEFNVALDELFRTDDGTRLVSFLATCTMLDAE